MRYNSANDKSGNLEVASEAFAFKPPRSVLFQKKIRTRLDLLSIPQSGGGNVKMFRWYHRLQIQNLFMVFKRVPLW